MSGILHSHFNSIEQHSNLSDSSTEKNIEERAEVTTLPAQTEVGVIRDMKNHSSTEKISGESSGRYEILETAKKLYVCNACDKAFTRKWVLTVHKRTHSGEKPYVCNMCDKAFTRKSDLTVHKRTHTNDKPYDCDTCGRAFAQRSTLITHIRTHT
ncbi:PREDICTED: zinc finger protein 431-like, partial [Tinamus guttatus]|uniref:zinc finger protein 431-like n=1 Tax=Tinamus guttatus TaxID=94827 RepID=UPI00052EF444